MLKINQISATDPDWSREKADGFWHPSAKLLRSIRNYQKFQKKSGFFALLICKIAVFRHRFWSVICGCDIPINANIDGGLKLIHPNGIVVHPQAYVGPNCLLLQQVTLVSGVKLAGHVDVGAGAKIVRPVMIGAHAKIGANAVVIDDVPDYGTAVGIPARVVKKIE